MRELKDLFSQINFKLSDQLLKQVNFLLLIKRNMYMNSDVLSLLGASRLDFYLRSFILLFSYFSLLLPSL